MGSGLLILAVLAPASLSGQGFRGELRVGASFIDLRPLVRDSVPADQVPGDDVRRRLPDGTFVNCIPGDYCRWYRAADLESFAVVTQDLVLTGWSGVEGLSAHVHLRGRFGSDDYWPLSSQDFEAVSAYVDFARYGFRLRAGRLFRTDGLGYYNFDGGSLLWRGLDFLWAEAYGGWGLPRGVNAPRNGDLFNEVEEIPPDDRGLIFGGRVGGNVGRVLSGSVGYQREIRTDEISLYSERATLDARALLGRTTVDVSARYDLIFQQFNQARLQIHTPLPANLDVTAYARHYTPFFEQWTIWGAFSPVGFNEAGGRLGWNVPGTGLRLEGGGAYREYEDPSAGVTFSRLREDGWRALGRAQWNRGPWFAGAGYSADVGFGAARQGGDLRFGRRFGPGTFLSAHGSLTQTLSETRLNEQFVSGIGLDGAVRLGDLSLNGGAGVFRLDQRERPQEGDWTQGRFYIGASYRFGLEPRASPYAGGG